MRFHKFRHRNGETWIDLDAVTAVERLSDGIVDVATGSAHWDVYGSVDDVLALVSPSAAPDRYEELGGLEDRPMTAEEEELPNPAWLNRPMVDAEVRRARLDELETLEQAFKKRGYDVPAFVETHIDWRKETIRKGEG